MWEGVPDGGGGLASDGSTYPGRHSGAPRCAWCHAAGLMVKSVPFLEMLLYTV